MSAEFSPFSASPEDGEAYWILGGLYTYRALAEQVGGAYTAIEVRGRRGMSAPVHYHDDETEAFYVAAGRVTLLVREEEISAGAGSFVWVPPSVKHAFRFEDEGRMLLLFTGGTGHEHLFRAIGQPAAERTIPPFPDEPPDVDEMAATAARHGTRIVGPPL